MNRISKLLISYLLMFSICFVTLSTMHVRADGETGGDNNDITMLAAPRTLSIEFMGKDVGPRETSVASGTFSSVDSDPYENVFWISVAVTGVEDLSIFNNGIYSFEVAFDYDPSFVEPYSDPVATDKEQDWNDNIKNGNLWTTTNNHGLTTYPESTWWDGTRYEVYSSRESEIDTSIRRDDRTLAATRKSNGWKMCSAQIRVTGTSFSATTARFYGLTSTDKQYLIKLPFRLLKVPAITDADQNPTVISLVRGTEKLSIGSGSDGVSPHSEWYPTDFPNAPTDEENMETLFNFAGDIKLFSSTSASAIRDIIPTQPANPPDIPADVTYTISRDKTEQQEGFAAATNKYYVTVPNDVDSIRLDINASSQPTAYLNTSSNTLTVTPSGTVYQTNVFNLDELDKTVEADGYNNKVVVTAGSSSYEVYIRRLLKPKIELNYGNSPYGEIMRDSAITDKASAKNAFNTANRYNSSYLPANVSDKLTMRYNIKAWNSSTDPDVNMDRNDYALFVYNKKTFKDSGFKAYDSTGHELTASDGIDVTRKIDVLRLTARNISENLSSKTPENITVTNFVPDYTFTEITAPALKLVRPDVYEMEYSFTDPYTNEVVTATRKIVVIMQRGDTNLDGSVNGTDQTPIINRVKGTALYNATTVPVTTGNLFVYRTCDTNMDGSVNGTDQTPIINRVKGTPIVAFYKEIQ